MNGQINFNMKRVYFAIIFRAGVVGWCYIGQPYGKWRRCRVNILVVVKFFVSFYIVSHIHYSFHFVFSHQRGLFSFVYVFFFFSRIFVFVFFCYQPDRWKRKQKTSLPFGWKDRDFIRAHHFFALVTSSLSFGIMSIAPCHWKKTVWFKTQKIPLLIHTHAYICRVYVVLISLINIYWAKMVLSISHCHY